MPSLTHNTPALRFPGYTGVWEQKQLEDVVTVYSGRDYKGIPAGNIPVYGTGGYMRSISQALSDNNDAIGIGRKGTIDHPFILKAPFWTVDTLFYCVPQHDYDLDFIYGLYQKVPWKALDESTGVPSLSKIAINHIKVLLPSLSEQRKIGSFFRHVDGLINLHQRQTQTLKKLKQGLLQKMFPQDGESVPRLRFPGFTDTWEQHKLKEIADFNPKSVLPEEFEYVDLQSVIGTSMVSHRTETKQTAPSRAQRLAQRGDVFFQTVRPYQKNNYLFSESHDNKNYVFSTGYAQMRPHIDPHFLMSFLVTDNFVKTVVNNCTEGTYPAINSNDLSQLIISVPDTDEQQKIGSFFNKLDDLIHLHKQYVTTLIHLKKGLLQKMFPQD